MGYPPLDHLNIPEVQEAIRRVLAAAKAAGKYAGMFCTSAEQIETRFEQGCEYLAQPDRVGAAYMFSSAVDFMNLGADVIALSAWNGVELAKLKGLRP